MQPMRAVVIIMVRAIAWLCIAAGWMATPAWAGDPQQIMADLSTNLFAALEREPPAARQNANRVRPLLDKLLAPHFDSECAARLVLANQGVPCASRRTGSANARLPFKVRPQPYGVSNNETSISHYGGRW